MSVRLTSVPRPAHAETAVLGFLQSGAFTLVFCGLIGLVFLLGWRYLRRERRHLVALNDYILLKYRLGHPVEVKRMPADVVAVIVRIEEAADPYRRRADIDGLWKRAVRLGGSVDFWVDLLQKLGLLGTVLGLGFALALEDSAVGDLLEPLSLAVWSTVAGLVGGIAISWRFGRDIDVEIDAYEENLREWKAALERGGEREAAETGA